MFTVGQVKAMDVNEIIALIEKRVKRELSSSLRVHIAMLHGAGEAGVKVMRLDQCVDYKEFLNYEDLTRLLNKEEL